MRKSLKKSSGGKGKQKRFKTRHHIRATLEDGSDAEEDEEAKEENSQSTAIRAMIAKMSPTEKLELITGIEEQDFQ